MAKTVYASNEGIVELSLDGGGTYRELLDLETFTIASENGTVDWVSFNQGGFKSNYVTDKGFTLSAEKKLIMNNDLDKDLLKLALTGDAKDHNGIKCKFTFPIIDEANSTPGTLEYDTSISFSDMISAGASDVAQLKFDLLVSGKPVFIEEAA